MSVNSGRKSIIFGILCLAVALGTIITAYLRQRATRGPDTTPAVSPSVVGAPSNNSGDVTTQAGVDPDSKTQSGESKSGGKDSAKPEETAKKSDDPFDYGHTPKVRGDVNAQVASAVEAVKTRIHPERLSVMITPKPFDVEEYKRNSRAYLDVVEPGRVNQPKQPGPGVPKIKAAGETHFQVAQGESVVLRVQAVPKMPVTWTSFDLGKFPNELTSISVETDSRGIAETNFFGTPGTIEDVHILCACPASSGQIRYTVRVTKPGGAE